jgi:hypothetical protein
MSGRLSVPTAETRCYEDIVGLLVQFGAGLRHLPQASALAYGSKSDSV